MSASGQIPGGPYRFVRSRRHLAHVAPAPGCVRAVFTTLTSTRSNRPFSASRPRSIRPANGPYPGCRPSSTSASCLIGAEDCASHIGSCGHDPDRMETAPAPDPYCCSPIQGPAWLHPSIAHKGDLDYLNSLAGWLSGSPLVIMPLREAAGRSISGLRSARHVRNAASRHCRTPGSPPMPALAAGTEG